MRWVIVALMTLIAAHMAYGNAGKTPAELGAAWARVSDVAEIQLIVDELRAGGRGVEGAVVVGKRVPQQMRQTFTKQHASGGGTFARSTGAAMVGRVRIEGNAATVEFNGENRLQLEKRDGVWRVTGGTMPPPSSIATFSASRNITSQGDSSGTTFITTAVSREHSITRLTKRITQNRLQRRLFGTAGKTASYLRLSAMPGQRFTIGTYVQFVLDPTWNRIVYGNLDRWIRAYPVTAPSAIAVDTDGNVFVGDPSQERILVLQLVGDGESELRYHHQINDVNPADIAVSDSETPFETADDVVYVADATANRIFKYSGGIQPNVLLASFEGFESPTGVAVGRWNGNNTGLIYVLDKIGRRLRVFEDRGSSLHMLEELRGNHTQHWASMKVDHFGHLYVADNVNSTITKLSPLLEVLDVDAEYSSPASIDIPFGRFEIGAERHYYGFNQLFTIERWDETSGAQRRTLGLKMRNIRFSADTDVSAVRNSFVLTDVGDVTVRIYDEKTNRLVRTLASSWIVAGEKNLLWDRRGDDGKQVQAGTFRYEVHSGSAYGGEPVVSSTRFYLPLFYHIDCGSNDQEDQQFRMRGTRLSWGSTPSQSAAIDEDIVRYRFTGLNPDAEYAVAAEFAAYDGISRLQAITAKDIKLGEPLQVTSTPQRTGYLPLPQSSYADGEVTIAVHRLGEGSAILTQLWIKETGVGFAPQTLTPAPSRYKLLQNYPNPFNPSTTIRYEVPEDAAVSLKVYNIAGQEIATLVNERKQAGTYEAVFDATPNGRQLPSGVYLYQIKAGSYTETRKMILVK